jgi:hypothetical protein
MNVRYRVELSQAERCELTAMLSKGKRAARKLKRAQILLAADAGRSDEEIARAVAVGGSHRVPDQAAFCGRQSGTGAERGSASWSGAQALRQGRSLAGGNGLRKPLPRVAPTGRWNCWPTPYARQPVDDSAVSAMFAGKWHAAEWGGPCRGCTGFIAQNNARPHNRTAQLSNKHLYASIRERWSRAPDHRKAKTNRLQLADFFEAAVDPLPPPS